MGEQEQLQSRFMKRFQRAEKYIKAAETMLRPVFGRSAECSHEERDVSGPLIPAVNQLRYAGFHASKAYAGPLFLKDELEAAIRHCERAIYDALDSQLQFYLFECLEFQRDYRTIEVHDAVKDYCEDKQILEEIKKSPTDRDAKDRYKEWGEKEKQLEQVHCIHRRWDSYREELNKRLKKERRNARFGWWGAIVGVAAIVGVVVQCCKGCE